ncbi:MAG TPA: lactonase family protein [Flavisolibacter sp.]|jgi:6-phosphogluconolactonase
MRFIILSALSALSLQGLAQKYYLFIGTYTGKGSKGIYVYRFDAATGKAEWVSNTDSVSNPSFLALSANGKYLYAVNENGGSEPGEVSAFSFDKAHGRLKLLNRQPSGGDHPCYITVTRNNKWVVAGNYTGGNLSIFPVEASGRLKPYAQLVQHSGSGPNPDRQEKAHVHATVLSPSEDRLLVPDLGMDKVVVYPFRPASGKPLDTLRRSSAVSKPGSGPRHLAFHPNGRFAYLMEEMSGTVAVYRYRQGKLEFVQRISSHPADFKGNMGSADIHLSPDGKFLYASNRGDANNIAIFSVNSSTGRLAGKGWQSTQGKTPRNFMIDPTGNYLLVANQQTNTVVIFKRNPATGLLRDTGHRIEVPNPVCLVMGGEAFSR